MLHTCFTHDDPTYHAILNFGIAGGFDAGARQRKKELQPGDEVFLEHERENRFDAKAIKLIHNGLCLGYVPAGTDNNKNSLVHALSNAAIELRAFVKMKHPDEKLELTLYARPVS